MFITLQSGVVVIHDGVQVVSTPFLDISARVSCCSGRGLLSIAFHPKYKNNGLFYVDSVGLGGDQPAAGEQSRGRELWMGDDRKHERGRDAT